MSNQTFGRSAAASTSTTALLDLERNSGRADRFQALDAFLGTILVRSLRGEQIIALTRVNRDECRVELNSLNRQQRAFLDTTFALTSQQMRGAWFIPDAASVRIGWFDLPAAMQRHERFAAGIAWEEREKLNLQSNADTMVLWALLEPLADSLYIPFALRGPQSGAKAPEETAKLWAESIAFLDALGLDVQNELAVLRPGKGWSKLRVAEQHAAKQRLMDAIARQITPETAVRYRAFRVGSLITQYYKKAKADGRAKRTQVVTKSLERVLSAFFGGDWLAFLDYLGETPHAEEEIVTQLPKPRLYVGTSSRAAEIAAQQGLPVEEVERMMATFWQQPASASPVEHRVALLRRYWEAFDAVHARQKVGMPSLWGFVEERLSAASLTETNAAAPHPFLYKQLLPNDLVAEIERLWGTMMLARYPEYIISNPYPHVAMAEAFGPALTFWHGCALTAWFLCEGPSSRTDMAGLAEYHRRHLEAMAACGAPVDPTLFEELIAAEQRLDPPQPINEDVKHHDVGNGISLTITFSSGSRRNGFERLRDIITRHRRAWAERYLDIYLRARWDTPLRTATQAYNKLLHDKGKPPTAKQTAKLAEDVTNQWFAGDLHAFYGAIGEKSPIQPVQRRRLPHDREQFIREVFVRLGGRTLGPRPQYSDRARYDAYNQQVQDQWSVARLTEHSLKYIQLWEVFDRLPTVDEAGGRTFEQWCGPIGSTPEAAWQRFSAAIVATVEATTSGLGATQQNIQTTIPELGIDSLRPEPSEPQGVPSNSSDHQSGKKAVQEGMLAHSSPKIQSQTQKRSWLDRLLGRK
ncbi:MAG: stress protein [Chloroflexota bacterium]|nr:stress protein [Chloroflexota bacterium]